MSQSEVNDRGSVGQVCMQMGEEHCSNIFFEKLSCRVPIGKNGQDKEILREACGLIRPGRLTALLGPSGAGKTTLLNILSGRRLKGISGRLHNRSPGADAGQGICVVPQDASLLGALSARESLAFAVALKLAPSTDRVQKDKVITDIADMLGITLVLDTRVCRLSGGEKKRLAVAVELVTDPPVLLLDEPTSGLDSVSSVQVIARIRQVARAGRAVLVSVHQPSSRLFHMFDDALLLAEGRTLYVGPVTEIVPTFQRAGFICPNYYNTADFVLEVASYELSEGNIKQLEGVSRNFVRNITTSMSNQSITYDKSDSKEDQAKNGSTALLKDSNGLDAIQQNGSYHHRYNASSWRQFIILLHRASVCNFRDFHLAQMRLICHVIVGLLLGAVYWQVGNDAAKINSNTSCLFFFLLFLYFANSMPNVHTFPSEAAVVFREHLNRWYSLHSYFFSKLLADLPLQILCTTAFVLPAYYMTNQQEDYWRVLAVWATCLMFSMQAQTFGLVSGAAFDMALGLFMVPAANIPMLMFSGFFIKSDEVPNYLSPLPYISYFRYAFESMMQVVYGFGRAKLDCSKPYCNYKDPEKYLQDLAMNQIPYEFDILALAVWLIFMQICFYLVLRWRIYKVCN